MIQIIHFSAAIPYGKLVAPTPYWTLWHNDSIDLLQ